MSARVIRLPYRDDYETVEIPVIDGEVVEDYPTDVIPVVRLLPPVPPSARAAARLPLPARVAARRRIFLGSPFVADIIARRYTLAGCALVLIMAATVLIATRGTYWTGTEWAPIPLDLTGPATR